MSDPSLPKYPDFPTTPPPYPTSGPAQAGAPPGGYPGEPAPFDKPASIRRAVQFMYAGAGLSAVLFLVGLFSLGDIRHTIRKQFPHYTTAQINTAVTAFTVTIVVAGIIAVGLWIWMARANDRGRSWGRVVGTVLFGLDTISVLSDLTNKALPALNLVFAVLPWACGLGAVVMMWNRTSSEYYSAHR